MCCGGGGGCVRQLYVMCYGGVQCETAVCHVLWGVQCETAVCHVLCCGGFIVR